MIILTNIHNAVRTIKLRVLTTIIRRTGMLPSRFIHIPTLRETFA